LRILGIDPGLSATGYGVIEVINRRVQCIDFGAIRNRLAKKEIAEKLFLIYSGIMDVIERFEPQYCAIEDIFYHENVNTAIVMGHARGVAMLAARQKGLEIYEYAAREVKMSIAGSGAASKHQVQAMVKNLLSLPEIPKPQDAADALAIALCHYHRMKYRQLTSTSR